MTNSAVPVNLLDQAITALKDESPETQHKAHEPMFVAIIEAIKESKELVPFLQETSREVPDVKIALLLSAGWLMGRAAATAEREEALQAA